MSQKILVIEDDNILQTAIKDSFVKEGYLVTQAFDGEAGFKKINQENPDLIILDLLMPVKSGEWVLTKMNENNLLNKCPLIVLTVKSDLQTMNNCLTNFNIKDYLIKGEYSLSMLLDKVKYIFKEKK